MKKLFVGLCIIFAVLFVGCSTESAPVENTVDNHDIPYQNDSKINNADEVLEVYSTQRIKVLKGNDLYVLRLSENDLADGKYVDYRELKYYDENDEIKINHFIIEEITGGMYRFNLISDDTVTKFRDFHQYSVYGDFVIADSIVYDGNLNQIGLPYGGSGSVVIDEETGKISKKYDEKVDSFSSLEYGGVISFSSGNTIHSYFHLKQLDPSNDTPTDETSTDYLIYGGCRYELPCSISGVVSQKELLNAADDIAYVLYLKDETDYRCMEISMIRGGASISRYFHGIDRPVSVEKSAFFNKYDAYSADNNSSISWLKDSNGAIRAFFGIPYLICGGSLMVEEQIGAIMVDTYSVYDKDLNKVLVLEDFAVLEDGTAIGKIKDSDEVALFGTDGSVVSRIAYEKVFAVSQYGAVVAEGDQVQFIDSSSTILAGIDGYRNEMEFWRQSSKLKGNLEQLHAVFTVPGSSDNPVDFWYDPVSHESGLTSWN